MKIKNVSIRTFCYAEDLNYLLNCIFKVLISVGYPYLRRRCVCTRTCRPRSLRLLMAKIFPRGIENAGISNHMTPILPNHLVYTSDKTLPCSSGRRCVEDWVASLIIF